MKSDDLHSRIVETATLMDQIDRQDAAITGGAQKRLEVVNKRLSELRPTAITNHDDDSEYQALTQEKGALQRTLARS